MNLEPVPIVLKGVSLWFAHLNVEDGQIRSCYGLLSADEKERAERFYFPIHRRRFIAARAGLRLLLGRYLGVDGAAVRLCYENFGKPVLDRFHKSDLRFNLAHCANTAIYAIARLRRIGVDIESAEEAAELGSRVPYSCFSAVEQGALESLAPGDRSAVKLKLWTRKEAYLKAIGCGLQIDLCTFEVSVPPEKPRLLCRADEDDVSTIWEFEEFKANGDLVGTVCVEETPSSQDLEAV